MLWMKILVFVCFYKLSLAFTSDSLKVQLDHGGVLVGRHSTTIKGRHIRAFKGVPYAKAPIENLRFKAPVEYPTWKGEKLAVKNPPMCIQIDPYKHSTKIEGNEDCLYLNIYTPPLQDTKKSGPLPVMVWFHGGGWQSGLGSDQLYGPKYLLEKDVILVSGNYRLGIFGFLSTETLDCPGNFGLKDQLEILKWVNKNIKSFGGDPNSVTIFGESAGGASVTFHMFSEKSKKLFQRGISQSGTYMNPWALQLEDGRAVARALKLGDFTNCKGTLIEMITCLRKLPAEKVIERFYDFFDWDIHPTIPFPPVVEPDHPEAFLTVNPRKSKQNSLDKHLMIGFVSHEGIIFTAPIFNLGNQLSDIKNQYKHIFPIILYYDHLSKTDQDIFTKQLDSFYFKNGHNYDITNHQNFTDIYSDGLINSGVDGFIKDRLTQTKASTYIYIFDHLGSASTSEIFGEEKTKMGVCHADELQYLFSWEDVFATAVPTERDEEIRDAMVEMWVNFATNGNPTPVGSSLPEWKAAKDYDRWNYARIGSSDGNESFIIKNEGNFKSESFGFWRKWNPHLKNNLVVKDEL